mgnify:CR=1 FL=1
MMMMIMMRMIMYVLLRAVSPKKAERIDWSEGVEVRGSGLGVVVKE